MRVKVTKTETRDKYCNNQRVLAISAAKEVYDTTYVVARIDGKWYVTQRE